MHPKPTIGILETGVTPPSLLPRFGRYAAMVARMLGDSYAFESFDVQAGRLPARPDACGAYLITGSSAGVYDPLPWIAPLEAFLRAARGRARIVGICFGHQVMAEAFGGRVEKAAAGWGLGLHRYALRQRAPWMDAGDDAAGADFARDDVAVAASHQDQVIVPPPDATVLGGNAFTPHGIIAYGDDALSFQFHPEFETAFAAALVERKRPHLGAAATDRALASLDAPHDAARVAGWIRRFVDGG